MKKKRILFLASIFFSIFLYGQTQRFIILGTLQGYEDESKIYLNDVSDGNYNKIDSSFVINGKFNFKGTLKSKYLKSSITSSDFKDRVTFWLEKGTTSFLGKKGEFAKSTIKGASIQKKWNELLQLLDTSKNENETEYKFIKSNSTSIISAYCLSNNFRIWSIDTISKLYNLFSDQVKQTKYGKRILSYTKYNKNIKVGDKFVDFSLRDTSNNLVTLSSFKDKVILLEFWGSWCNPCREENPSLLKIYNEFKPKGFEIFGVASETDKQKWINAIRNDGLTWTNTSELKGSDSKAELMYGITGYPTNFLIDKTGIIVAKDLYEEELRNILLKLLK
jgi:thiol-disulfide isomerase/thioredoxin